MSKWKYRGKIMNTPPENAYGFVYIIVFPSNNDYYIGSKQFYFNRNVIMSKKAKKEFFEKEGLRRKRKTVSKESDWKEYLSSSKTIEERCKIEEAKFIIQELFDTKQHMLLKEAYLIAEAFLDFDEKILNSWLSIKAVKLKNPQNV